MTRRWNVVAGPLALRFHVRSVVVAGLLVLALVGAILASLTLGAHPVGLVPALQAVFGEGSVADELIVGQLRLPRVLTGALVGAALGMAGSLFQSVTRNPLGSPDVIGFTSGASTGALVAILVLGMGAGGTAIGAVLGGAATAAIVFALATRHGVAPLRLVLVGIGAGAILLAVNQLMIVRSQLYDAQSAAVWLVGSLAGRGWPDVMFLLPVVIIGGVLAAALASALTLGEFSDDRSASLGLRPGRVRLGAVTVGVLLASAAVAAAGPIQFVALAAPQISRRLTGATGPNALTAALTGSVLLVLSDLAAREAFQPRQLPVGVVTGLVGGLYLIWLLGHEWRKGRG
ncbi:iron chelate uptake ABC transporter family permease subunit [Herbiconiux moechotypicola]|uniref:Iron chelate uptake ABC transporter family permease subunit n=1 Tax=Herbiconiux moechotypicola TaxID=637393 RepID=A0ABN3DFT2_9MICO|nr:iron chelate uptake ABC transporter family permease subunit [Herbiconiux moechotypicola]MCS5729377.1 iron chelate uptake ABC transporter family permease subunit [Herbiconiux moechotypicola]